MCLIHEVGKKTRFLHPVHLCIITKSSSIYHGALLSGRLQCRQSRPANRFMERKRRCSLNVVQSIALLQVDDALQVVGMNQTYRVCGIQSTDVWQKMFVLKFFIRLLD
jgi:hypothetical protein